MAFPNLAMFLYRNNTEVIRHLYSKATGPDSYKRHSHITDITNLVVTQAHMHCHPKTLLQNFGTIR